MPRRELIISALPAGTTVIGGINGMVSFGPPTGQRTIPVRIGDWPSGLPTPWTAGSAATLTFQVLDLLRCTTRYFFIESWLAGRTDGWVLGLPVIEYLAKGPDLCWRPRNANVARWLSELAGVGLACYVMELCGAVNISLGNKGTSGPDYQCRIPVKGKFKDVVFECKGSSTRSGLTAQIEAACDQVATYKNRGRVGIISAACIPPAGTRDRPRLYLSDPPIDDEFEVSPFQADIASLAVAIGWAGEPGLAHDLASTVVSFGESTREEPSSIYLPEKMAFERLHDKARELSRSLKALAERAGPRTALVSDGGRLIVIPPIGNIQQLARLLEQNVEGATQFRVRRDEQTNVGHANYMSVAPDGSAMIWEPSQQQ
jgi:hypothetical protein